MAIEINNENFEEEVLKSELPVMIDFYAEWCGPCKMIAPIIKELATEFEGKWKICKIDVDAAPELAQKYNVQSIPTIIYLEDGEETSRLMGFKSKDALKEKLVVIPTAE